MDSQCYFWHNDQFDISLRPKVTSNTGSSLFWQPLVKAIRSSSCDTGRDGLNMLLGRPQTRFLLATVSHEPKHQYHPVSPTPTFTNKALQCDHYKRMFMDKFQLQGSPFSHKSDPGNFPKRMAVDGEAHDSKPVGLFVRPGSVPRRCEVPLMLRGGLGTMTASKSECIETISHWIGLYKEKNHETTVFAVAGDSDTSLYSFLPIVPSSALIQIQEIEIWCWRSASKAPNAHSPMHSIRKVVHVMTSTQSGQRALWRSLAQDTPAALPISRVVKIKVPYLSGGVLKCGYP